MENKERTYKYYVEHYSVARLLKIAGGIEELPLDTLRKLQCFLVLRSKETDLAFQQYLLSNGWSNEKRTNLDRMNFGNGFWAFLWEPLEDQAIYVEDPSRASTDTGDYIKKMYPMISVTLEGETCQAVMIRSFSGRG